VSITDEEVEQYYEENLAEQTRPASVSFEQLVIEPKPGDATRDSALEVAHQVLAELRDGKDFEVAARQYSMDLSNRDQGGDLGWIQRSQLVQAFADAAWSARTGQPIGPVETRFGYHIVRRDKEVEMAAARQIFVTHAESTFEPRSDRTREEARARAQEALDKIRSGIDLADLVLEYSEGTTTEVGGDLGRFPRGASDPALDDLRRRVLRNPAAEQCAGGIAGSRLYVAGLVHALICSGAWKAAFTRVERRLFS